MIIVWSGYGFLTVFFAWIGLFIGALLGQVLPKNVGVGLGLLLAAASNHILAQWLANPERQREMIDVKTGQRVVMRDGSSLLFLPVRYWTHILGISSFVAFGLELSDQM